MGLEGGKLKNQFNRSEIREKAVEYDLKWGAYPESYFEGFTIYCHIMGLNENDERLNDSWLLEIEKKRAKN